MNENLEEAINHLNYYNKWDDAQMDTCVYSACFALIECIKDMQAEIDKLKEHLKYLENE